MPKKIDDELKARAVRLVNDHQGEYASLTAAAAVVAKQLGVGKESVRRWVIQSQIDGGHRAGASSEELAEIKALKAENRRLRGRRRDSEIAGPRLSSSGNSTPATVDHGFHRHHEGRRTTRSSRSVGCCASRAARSPRGPTAAGNEQDE